MARKKYLTVYKAVYIQPITKQMVSACTQGALEIEYKFKVKTNGFNGTPIFAFDNPEDAVQCFGEDSFKILECKCESMRDAKYMVAFNELNQFNIEKFWNEEYPKLKDKVSVPYGLEYQHIVSCMAGTVLCDWVIPIKEIDKSLYRS